MKSKLRKRPLFSFVSLIESYLGAMKSASTHDLFNELDRYTKYAEDLIYYAERRGYIRRVKRGNRYTGPAIWKLVK